MAATMIPIQSITLTGSAASVTFTGIPQTYTDLVVRMSIRDNSSYYANILFAVLSGDSGTNYSQTRLYAADNVAASGRRSSTAGMIIEDAAEGSTNTANTLSSVEMIIPNYTGSGYKPLAITSAVETNTASTNYMLTAQAGLWRNSAAVSSIMLYPSSANFVSGSTFHLYGIKKD